MAKKEASVHKDFELFEAIFKEAEDNAEEDELFFQVSPVRKQTKDDRENLTSTGGTTELGGLDSKSHSDKKEKKLSLVEEVVEKLDLIEENTKYDYKPIDDESIQSDNISEIVMEKIDTKPVVESESEELLTWTDSSSGEEENHKSQNQHHVKFVDMQEKKSKPKKTLSLSVDYDSFREFMESSKKSPRNDVDDSSRSEKNHHLCQCPNCPGNRYKKSNFPLFSQLVDDENEDDNKEQQTRKKRKAKKKKKKKQTKQAEDKTSARKPKLDARLSNSGNPSLLMWLEEKNKLEKQKRRRERKEKKIHKGESKEGLSNGKSIEEKRQEKLNEWIERKKKEMREQKQKLRVSSHLETDPKKPIIHNQRPKTAAQKRSPRVYMKPEVESKDILAPASKQRPKSSPAKSVRRKVPTEEDTVPVFSSAGTEKTISHEANGVKSTSQTTAKPSESHENLNDQTHQTSFTSVKMFINSVVENAIEELDRQNRIKEARLRQRPKTSRSSRQNGVVWKDQEDLSARSQSRPFSSVTRQPASELNTGIKPSLLKLKRPATSMPRRIQTNTLVEDEKAKNRHQEWLEEKNKQEKKKKELQRREQHYDRLEATLVQEEQARQRKEVEESKQRIKTGLRRQRETKEKVEQYQPVDMIRPEPQGSESFTKAYSDGRSSKAYSDGRSSSASSLPEIRNGTPIIGFNDDVNNIPIFGAG